MAKLDDELTEINEKIVDPAKLKLTTENFLNPLNSLDLQLRTADMLQMDVLVRKKILGPQKWSTKKRSFIDIKESFQSLVSEPKLGQNSCGDPGGT